MPGVTLKLPQELKTRINDLAAASGKSPHAFMMDALAAQAARAKKAAAHSSRRRCKRARKWSATAR